MRINIAVLGSISGMLGATFVAIEKPFWANIIWFIGNPLLIYHNYKIHEKAQMYMFAYYIVCATFGIIYHYIGE